uniref:Aldedh domain-containing protein n=1 Tax=Panagrellus redivivus TaxID=6233 RepID=A0A7E4UTC3_PANRE
MSKFTVSKQAARVLNFVGGKRISLATNNNTFKVYEPRSGEVLTEVEAARRSDVETALQAAHKAQTHWASIPPPERGVVLRRAAELIRENVDDISYWEVIDNGKPIEEAKADVLSCAETFDYFSAVDLNGEHIPLSDADKRLAYTRREPLGVVGAIGAWNYPIQTATWKIAPAIACGNAIIYKPSPLTPVTAVILAELLQSAGVPDGLVNVLQGGGLTGGSICQARGINKVTFTGSVSTGKLIAQGAAADYVKPVTLELGGKSSCIIFEDCDIDMAVSGAMMANFYSQGQVCSNASKVLVHRSILEPFTKSLIEHTAKMPIGDPLNPKTRIGATVSAEHLAKVNGFTASAVAEGAKLLHGGQKASVPDFPNGYYLEPAVLTGITPKMTVYGEEIFGAVLLIIPFDTDDEALGIANDTCFGLAAGIFTNNLARAHTFINKLHAGNVYVNTYNDVSPAVPFGGYGQSGYGRENGKAAVEHYSQIKSVFINASGKLDNPF